MKPCQNLIFLQTFVSFIVIALTDDMRAQLSSLDDLSKQVKSIADAVEEISYLKKYVSKTHYNWVGNNFYELELVEILKWYHCINIIIHFSCCFPCAYTWKVGSWANTVQRVSAHPALIPAHTCRNIHVYYPGAMLWNRTKRPATHAVILLLQA